MPLYRRPTGRSYRGYRLTRANRGSLQWNLRTDSRVFVKLAPKHLYRQNPAPRSSKPACSDRGKHQCRSDRRPYRLRYTRGEPRVTTLFSVSLQVVATVFAETVPAVLFSIIAHRLCVLCFVFHGRVFGCSVAKRVLNNSRPMTRRHVPPGCRSLSANR